MRQRTPEMGWLELGRAIQAVDRRRDAAADGYPVIAGVRQPGPEAREDRGRLARPCLSHEEHSTFVGAHRPGVHHATPVIASPPVEDRAERRRPLVARHTLRRGRPEHGDARCVVEHTDAPAIETEQPVHSLIAHMHELPIVLVPRGRGPALEKLPGCTRQADVTALGEINGERRLAGWTGGEVLEGTGQRGGEGWPRTA